MRKLLFTIGISTSIAITTFAATACNQPFTQDGTQSTCSLSNGEFICEIDVYDPETNQVQTYYDMLVQVEDCNVIAILSDGYNLDEIIHKSSRAYTEKHNDAQTIGDDGKTYNFYSFRVEEYTDY